MGYPLPIAVLAVVAALPGPTWIRNLATDDALYYPTVARNLAAGLGSTYDGFTPTNGYHPLWCWAQVPIAAVTSTFGPMTYLWCVKLLMVVVVGLALMIWARLLRELTGSNWMSAAFVMLLGGYWWSVRTLNSGMETPLVVLLMGVSLLLAHRLFENRSTATAVLLGGAMAATFLARLDSIFFIGILSCVALVTLRGQLRLVLAWLAPLLALPIPYLWWNFAVFGSVMPVSGIRKSVSRPSFNDQLGILTRFVGDRLTKAAGALHPAGMATAGLILILALAMTWVARREFRDLAVNLDIVWVLPVGAGLHFLYVATFMVEAHVSWYQYAEYLTGFLAVSAAVAAGASWIRARDTGWNVEWVPFVAVLAATVSAIAMFAPRAMPDVANVRSYDAALWARDNLATPDARPRFGMYDPGVFQYVSGLPTIALSGLASTRQVVTLVQERNWSEIIRRYGIKYVVQFVPSEAIPSIPADCIKYRSESFRKYSWRYSQEKDGRLLILDASYPLIDSLI